MKKKVLNGTYVQEIKITRKERNEGRNKLQQGHQK